VKRAGVIARAIAPAIVPVIAREIRPANLGLEFAVFVHSTHFAIFACNFCLSPLSFKIHLP
jgi:hypothetical protein